MESKHIIPPQLDYGRSDCSFPKYKFSRIVPLSGSQSVTIPNASTAETLMEIPTNVCNLAQSYLFADVAYPAQGGGVFTWAYVYGMPLISEIDLYTRSGIYLCQIANFQWYMNMIRPLFTPWGEYITNGQSSYFFPSNQPSTNPPTPPNVTPNNGPGQLNFLEPAYVVASTAAATGFSLTLNLPLNAIKRTIFELNKDIVWPDIIVLRILWGPAINAGFGGTSNQDPNVGDAALTGTIAITNLTLYLATEKNEDLAQSVRGLVNSPGGMNILVDYPYIFKNSLSGTSQNISIRANRGH